MDEAFISGENLIQNQMYNFRTISILPHFQKDDEGDPKEVKSGKFEKHDF